MSTKTEAKPSAVRRAKDYSKAISKAYDMGYRDGYAAYESLPEVRGAYTAAKYGYGRGMKSHKKVNKYQSKARRP